MIIAAVMLVITIYSSINKYIYIYIYIYIHIEANYFLQLQSFSIANYLCLLIEPYIVISYYKY